MADISLAVAPLFWALVTFFGFSALVLGLCLLAQKCWYNTAQWRGFWIAASIICWLPTLFMLMPDLPLAEPLFDLPALAEADLNPAPLSETAVSNSSGLSITALMMQVVVVTVIVGALLHLIAQLFQLNFLRKQTLSARDFLHHPALNPLQKRYCRRLQRQLKVRIRITDTPVSPYVFGLWRPQLVLTAGVLNTLEFNALKLIIRHEWTHIQRGDYRWVLLAHLSRSLVWFNPCYRAIIDALLWSIELSCDAKVLEKKPKAIKQYAKAIIDVVAQVSRNQRPQLITFTSHQPRSIHMRITTLINTRTMKKTTLAQRLSIAICALGLTSLALFTQANTVKAADLSSTHFQHPVPNARVSSSFGQKETRFHNGIDLAISTGTPIVAAAGGKVLVSTDVYGDAVNYGKMIIIEHDNGLKTLYSHLDTRLVEAGDSVAAGEKIGEVGETGKVTGPHLHLEIIDGEKRLNPSDYIEFSTTKTIGRLTQPKTF